MPKETPVSIIDGRFRLTREDTPEIGTVLGTDPVVVERFEAEPCGADSAKNDDDQADDLQWGRVTHLAPSLASASI